MRKKKIVPRRGEVDFVSDIKVNGIPIPGVCRICGCTETNPCKNLTPVLETCSWANKERTLCSFCSSKKMTNASIISAQLSSFRVFGSTLHEIKKIIAFAKSKGYKK